MRNKRMAGLMVLSAALLIIGFVFADGCEKKSSPAHRLLPRCGTDYLSGYGRPNQQGYIRGIRGQKGLFLLCTMQRPVRERAREVFKQTAPICKIDPGEIV